MEEPINKLIINQKNLRTISLGFTIPMGSSLETDIHGINSVLLSHLQRQTSNRNEDEFAEYIDSLGISTFSSAGRASTTLGVNTPPQHLESAFNILKEMVLEPEFDDSLIQRIVQQKKGQLQQIQSSPESILTNYTRWKSAYGKDPITNHPTGKMDELGKITADHLEDWYNELFKYKMYFACVGVDVSASKLENLGLESFMSEFGNNTPSLDYVTPPSKKLNSEVDQPSMPSSNAYIGINFRLPDTKDLNLEDNIYSSVLAGGMSARMFKIIREEKNLSYGPGTSRYGFKGGSLLSAMMDVKQERAEEALRTTLNLMYDTLTSKIPEDEMYRALKGAQRIAVFVADSATGYTKFLLSKLRREIEYDLEKIKEQLAETAKGNWQEVILKEWDPSNLSFSASGDAGDVVDKWEKIAKEVF